MKALFSYGAAATTAEKNGNIHYLKEVRIPDISGPYFPAFGLHTEIYSVNLRIQSEYGKIWTRKPPNMHTCHAVVVIHLITRSLDGNHKTTDILEYFRKR